MYVFTNCEKKVLFENEFQNDICVILKPKMCCMRNERVEARECMGKLRLEVRDCMKNGRVGVRCMSNARFEALES